MRVVAGRLHVVRYAGLGALFILFLVLAPGVLGGYWVGQLTLLFVYVVAVLGTDLVVGRTGVLSLCQASFMGLGAYAASVGGQHGAGFGVQVAGAILIGAAAGIAVAVPTLRLSGLRLAIVTLLFGLVFEWALDANIGLTGGSEGMAVSPISVAGVSSTSAVDLYVVTSILAGVLTFGMWRLVQGSFGPRLLAVRDAPLAARAVGISIRNTRILVVALGAVLCALAGLFYAYAEGSVAPTDFDTFPAIYLVVAVLLGGRGSLLGAWLGAAYVVLLPDAFTSLGIPNAFPLVGGAVLILVTLVLPKGIAGTALGLLARWPRTASSERLGLGVNEAKSD